MKDKFRYRHMFLLKLPFVLLLWVLLFSLVLLEIATKSAKVCHESQDNEADSLITIVFAGDVMGHDLQIETAYDPVTGEYDYSDCFRFVEPYLKQADLACANLEVTFGGPPYKGYPCFSTPDALLPALCDAGFDLLFTANNHVLDRGKPGLERTIGLLDSIGMLHAGSYVDSISCDTSYPLIVDVKGLKVGFVNATYGTNGLKEKFPNVVNRIDTVVMNHDLDRLSAMGADLMIAVMHWGIEYELKGNARQQSYAESLIAHGADLIIGGHPHVVQNADTLYTASGQPVVVYYSMGNFISNQRRRETLGGIMIKATVNRFTGRVVATEYIPYYVCPCTIHDKHQFYVIPIVPYLEGRLDFSLPRTDSLALRDFYGIVADRLSNFNQCAE